MKFSVAVHTIYNSSLERAFKTPMLCDLSKVHTGFWFMPKVTHCTNDERWGEPGQSKKVFVAKSLTQKGGWGSSDKVLERKENENWTIEVSNFQTWMLGFNKFVGQWKTTQLQGNQILVEYSYELHANTVLLYPFNWLFAKTFWRMYMKQVLENVRKMAYENEPYRHE